MKGNAGPSDSDKRRAVFDWAQGHAAASAAPSRFMKEFEEEMSLLAGPSGEAGILDRMPEWHDYTALAAEIEALAAHRALQCWGTQDGMVPISYPKTPRRAS